MISSGTRSVSEGLLVFDVNIDKGMNFLYSNPISFQF